MAVLFCIDPELKTYPPPAEPFGADPRFPPIVLTGTFVTPVAPNTAKLAKSAPNIGAANAVDAQQMAAAKLAPRVNNDKDAGMR
jgi:hypothetical protein